MPISRGSVSRKLILAAAPLPLVNGALETSHLVRPHNSLIAAIMTPSRGINWRRDAAVAWHFAVAAWYARRKNSCLRNNFCPPWR